METLEALFAPLKIRLVNIFGKLTDEEQSMLKEVRGLNNVLQQMYIFPDYFVKDNIDNYKKKINTALETYDGKYKDYFSTYLETIDLRMTLGLEAENQAK